MFWDLRMNLPRLNLDLITFSYRTMIVESSKKNIKTKTKIDKKTQLFPRESLGN